MYPPGYQPDSDFDVCDCTYAYSCPIHKTKPDPREEDMSQFDEDEDHYWFLEQQDVFDAEPPPKRRPLKSAPAAGRVRVELPGTRELGSFLCGETFKFPNSVNQTNVYMVISEDFADGSDVDDVHYVHLNTGKVYYSLPSKCVIPISVKVVLEK